MSSSDASMFYTESLISWIRGISMYTRVKNVGTVLG